MMIGADHYIPGTSIGARARNRCTSDSSISGAPSVGRAPNLRARVRVASLLQGVVAPVQKEVRAAYCARAGINPGRRFITRTLCPYPRDTPIHLPTVLRMAPILPAPHGSQSFRWSAARPGDRQAQGRYWATYPPSTTMAWPVTNEAESEQSHATASASCW